MDLDIIIPFCVGLCCGLLLFIPTPSKFIEEQTGYLINWPIWGYKWVTNKYQLVLKDRGDTLPYCIIKVLVVVFISDRVLTEKVF